MIQNNYFPTTNQPLISPGAPQRLKRKVYSCLEDAFNWMCPHESARRYVVTEVVPATAAITLRTVLICAVAWSILTVNHHLLNLIYTGKVYEYHQSTHEKYPKLATLWYDFFNGSLVLIICLVAPIMIIALPSFGISCWYEDWCRSHTITLLEPVDLEKGDRVQSMSKVDGVKEVAGECMDRLLPKKSFRRFTATRLGPALGTIYSGIRYVAIPAGHFIFTWLNSDRDAYLHDENPYLSAFFEGFLGFSSFFIVSIAAGGVFICAKGGISAAKVITSPVKESFLSWKKANANEGRKYKELKHQELCRGE